MVSRRCGENNLIVEYSTREKERERDSWWEIIRNSETFPKVLPLKHLIFVKQNDFKQSENTEMYVNFTQRQNKSGKNLLCSAL